MEDERPEPVIHNLQALRAGAALSVATFHFALIPAAAVPWHHGSFGVDLFFVLSGFIIAHSTTRGGRHFLRRRLIRVLPPYWMVTTLGVLPILLAMPLRDALCWYGQSLLFITGPGGRPPIIFVSWTLIYELAFYLIYAATLRIGGSRVPLIAAAALLALAYGAHPAGLTGRNWPLLTEFVFGLAIFVVTERAGLVRVRPSWGMLLVMVGLAGIVADEQLVLGREGAAADQVRVLVLGVPAALVVLGLLLLERAGVAMRSRSVLALGAASYALYLLHPLVLSFALPLGAGSPARCAAVFTALVAASIGGALAFHRWIEAPLLRFERRSASVDAEWAPVPTL